MARVYNFSAGPSMLPESVLKKAAAEMLDYEGSGQSVMEMSHRSKTYDKIIKYSRQLQGSLPSGRRFDTVRHGCPQPHEQEQQG